MVGKNLSCCLSAQSQILIPTSTELNLLDYRAVSDYIGKHSPQMIIHCAGRVGGIHANMQHPFDFFYQNLEMGKNLILAARENNVEKLLNLASSCIYPRNIEKPINESMILKGELEPTNEAYALAKIAVLKLCQYISAENNFYKYKTIIPCNLYGPFDKFDPEKSHMIPSVIRKIHLAYANNEDSVEIWGDGKARREFMYVGDLVEFIKKAVLDFELLPDIMNVGLGYDHSIDEYYEAVARIVGYRGKFIHNVDKPTGMLKKVVDISRVSDFGWKAKTNLEDGIKLTYQYFKSVRN